MLLLPFSLIIYFDIWLTLISMHFFVLISLDIFRVFRKLLIIFILFSQQ